MSNYSPIFTRTLQLVVFVVCMSSVRGVADATSSCRKTPFLYVFGDSNSDTGGGSVVSATVPQLPDGRLFFNNPTGRICDGRLLIDLLCESLGTKYLTPFFKILSSSLSDYSNGVNFALAGSDTLRRDESNAQNRLKAQVKQFGFFYNLSITNGFMSAARFRDDALYLFDIGQNDIAGNFDTFSYHKLLRLIPTSLSNIKAAIQTVYNLGGRKFWVHSTGPLGCLPNSVAKKNASKPLDALGCIARENEAAMKLNAGLKKMCEELRSAMGDATIVFVDLYSIKLDLVANSTANGFGDPFTSCRNKEAKTVCPLGGRCVSWDGVHYTEAANMFIKSKILSTNFSTPPFEFNFFCN